MALMNVIKLNEYLSGNSDAIEEILNNLGCTNIHLNSARNEFRCSRDFGKNPSAVKVDIDTLSFNCYSTGERGSIYNFIMSKKNLKFPKALEWTADILGLEKNRFSTQIVEPFGGFYKNLIRTATEPELYMNTYDEEILNEYGPRANLTFFKDGIDFVTQEFFNVGYDADSDRITIPEWDVNGRLVGIMGRSNDPNIDYKYRWMPIIPCSRSYTLYGYHINYSAIQQKQMCVVVESEKGVMQMKSMGYNFGLATCTNSVSSVQEKYIKALRVEQVILGYDQGISEEQLRYEALKLKLNNPIYCSKIGYIYDKDGEILKKDSKFAPTDLGRTAFNELLKNHVKWI